MATELDNLKATLRKGYLRRYLEAVGCEILSGGQLRCPNKAAHKNGDVKPSAHLYEDGDFDRVKCFGCGEHWDIFALCQMVEGVDFIGSMRSLARRFGLDFPEAVCADRTAVRPSVAGGQPSRGVECPTPVRSDDADRYLSGCAARIASTDYFSRRGISQEVASRFGCGFDPACWFPTLKAKAAAVIFPASGGWAARSVDGKAHAFAKGARGSAFNLEALWNTEPVQPVFIVEGQFDALSVLECGGQAVALGGLQHIAEIVRAVKLRTPSTAVVIALDHETDPKLVATVDAAHRKLADGLRAAGAFVYDPGVENVFGAHDANDALLADRSGFAATLRLIGFEASEAYQRRNEPKPEVDPWAGFVYSAAEIPEPVPEEDNPRAVFANGYLRKGQVLTVVSCPGVGKSVLTNQSAISWAAGEADIIGLKPVAGRPLRTLVIQFEDDLEEMSEFFADYEKGFTRPVSRGGLGWSREKFVEARSRVDYLDVRKLRIKKKNPLTDESLVSAIADIQHHRHYQLIVINPLTSAMSEFDISNNTDANKFFRQMLQPVLDNPETECALILIHHTSKVPRDAKSLDAFLSGVGAQYAAQGASALMNWQRAQMFIAPTKNPGDFRLIGSKRERRLGWVDLEGKPVREKYISYSDIMFWVPTPECRVASLVAEAERSGCRRSSGAVDTSNDATQLAAALRALPKAVSTTEMWDKVIKKMFTGHDRQEAVRDRVKENPGAYGVAHFASPNGNGRMVEYWGGPTQLPIPDAVGKVAAAGDEDADGGDGEPRPW